MINKWSAFCRKVIKQDLDFNGVVNLIVRILELPYSAILNETEFFGKWNAVEKKYD
jgi:hypothetical protein